MQDFQSFLAPAKINLFLHITGKRTDGYHTLQSVFQLLDFYDTIHIKITQNNAVNRTREVLHVPASQCLCGLAAIALKEATNCKLGVDYFVDKKIPMGGGLGGGSSDAATMLLALNKLWDLQLSRQALMQIGLKLGADVPVFIFGQTAWAEGVGELLTAVDLPARYQDVYYLVLTPLVHVATAQVFANPRLTRDTKPLKIADFSSGADFALFNNNLEKIVCEEFPAVASTLKWLSRFESKDVSKAKMSGSGASVFVAVNSKQLADELLSQKPANNTGFVAKGLIKHPHFDLLN